MEQNISCNKCGNVIPLDQALTAQIKGKLEVEMSEEYKNKLEDEKKKIWFVAQEKAVEKFDLQMKDLQNQVVEKEKKLTESREKELAFLKRERELEEQKKNFEIEMERKLQEQSRILEEQARQSVSDEYGKKMMEKEHQMEQMRKTIEDLRRKSEQGSMQVQGDMHEEAIKSLLQSNFPMDLIEDVPTGVKGGDLIQTVRNGFGQDVGVVLWESKNTKAWSDAWLKKLKEDQGIAKADICILVSTVLPEGVENFGMKDGVWICSQTFALSLIQALRFHLKEIGQVKKSLVGRDEKMQQLFEYLSGNQFKNRIENIVMAFTSMKGDLETEKRSMSRIWAKREKDLDRMVLNTSSLYGDLQGIIGSSLSTVEALELNSGDEIGLEEEAV